MRYQKIHSQIWNDEKFTALSPMQQRLFLYILTCPHGNIIGLFVLKKGYACDDLKVTPKDFEKDLRKLIEKEIIKYDFTTSLVLIKKFLRHNPLTNPNQIKAAVKMFSELPKSQLFQEFIEVLPEALKKSFPKQPEAASKPETETETEEEKEKEEEKETPTLTKKYLDSVMLKDEEYRKLQEVLGQKSLDIGIEKLDYSITCKGGKYKDHYKTLLNWHKRGYLNTGVQRNVPSQADEAADILKRIQEGTL